MQLIAISLIRRQSALSRRLAGSSLQRGWLGEAIAGVDRGEGVSVELVNGEVKELSSFAGRCTGGKMPVCRVLTPTVTDHVE